MGHFDLREARKEGGISNGIACNRRCALLERSIALFDNSGNHTGGHLLAQEKMTTSANRELRLIVRFGLLAGLCALLDVGE